jgi:RimJ/RimL family protein N-acetyltransferase
LEDPEVNRYLETRWAVQTLDAIRDFVSEMAESPHNYLFAMIENASGLHIGNIKLGPICPNHRFAEVGFFIGERSCWGAGFATEAIRLVAAFAFGRLGLNRIHAGLYSSNRGSAKALLKAGFRMEGVFRKELRRDDGGWDDHEWYGLLREEWEAGP